MKRILIALALLLPMSAWGQNFSGRASAGVDVKLAKGLHLSAQEELRTSDGFSGLGSMRTTVGLNYKPFTFLKVGIGGTLINPFKNGKTLSYTDSDGNEVSYDYTGFWAPKYRLFADVTGHYRLGDFQFSLKEKLQLTHNSDLDMNVYQSTRNALALKSKVGVKYKRFSWIEPGLYFELRTALNDPWGTYDSTQKGTSDTKGTYYAYTPSGYTHVYNTRYRINLEADIQFDRHHTLTPYFLLDYLSEYVLDTNKSGTKYFVNSTHYAEGWYPCVGLSYVYKF
ncbi:MAG: DUF2490 domain-containing protein [Bacteroidales bacterium]|nr:DUF2490 domain-containing protein [Bacteroidales bacterium]